MVTLRVHNPLQILMGNRMRALARKKMNYFDHEKLDVYKAAIKIVLLIEEVITQFPRGRAYLVDQWQGIHS